jgi:hypothetical protein
MTKRLSERRSLNTGKSKVAAGLPFDDQTLPSRHRKNRYADAMCKIVHAPVLRVIASECIVIQDDDGSGSKLGPEIFDRCSLGFFDVHVDRQIRDFVNLHRLKAVRYDSADELDPRKRLKARAGCF